MRRSSMSFALHLALVAASLPALAATPEASAKEGARSVWLVQFEDAPLAAFRGADAKSHPRLRGLEATSPAATGKARLDVDSAASQVYRDALAMLRHERLEQAAVQVGRRLDPLFVYDVVNHGVALELTAAEAQALMQVDGVATVEPEFVHEPQVDAGPAWIKADALWQASGGGWRGEGRIVGVIDTGIQANHRMFQANSGGHAITNPRNRYLGRCASNASAGCNAKLIGIYDFTTGEGDAETNDGSDPNGHGTHVAATAAGNPVSVTLSTGSYALSGVAPRANIVSYKACEVESKCRGSWTLAALNQAVADQVDVINYSIGGDPRNPWNDSGATAMLNAREAGVVVVVAAGNEGPSAGSHTSPGNAPWVIGVANTTHDRANVARLTLSGGSTPPPGGGALLGASLTTTPYGPAPIVHASQFGSALCATGSNVDALPPDTSTSPWSGRPFSGQIVVCDRGIYARVVKGLNVRNAGAGGMVLLNMQADGASIVADPHQLPATHLGHLDGVSLRQWLSSGDGHQARIEASTVQRVAAFGDVLASSSGRGPVDGDWLKPNLAAPGSNILAAYRGGPESYQFLSGTSMASPHVAGAVALLRQARPGWGPSEIESALQTTARASVRLPDGASAAGVFDAGAGTIDVSRAVHAGLAFPSTPVQFRNANPAQGGQPRDINQPALVDRHCHTTCTFTRTVKDLLGGGQWQAAVHMPGGSLSVTPASFTLTAGATQTLSIRFDATAATAFGQWQQGHVVFSRVGGDSPDVIVPVAVKPSAGNLPDAIVLPRAGASVPAESGWAAVTLNGLIALPSARFSGSDLIEPLMATTQVSQDPTPDEIYDRLAAANEGVSIFRLRAERTERVRLRVEVGSNTAPDIDLFVGRAVSVGDMPSQASEICRSTSPQSAERCELDIDVTAGEQFWILLQNWKASAAGRDTVTLHAGLVPLQPSTRRPDLRPLIATGPGHVAANAAIPLRLAWNDPTMLPGQSRWGHLLIGAGDENPTGVGAILVKLTRASAVQHAAAALQPDVARSMHLRAGHAQDRLHIDVPPNATALHLRSRGEGDVKLFLVHDPAPSSPAISAAPPRSTAAGSSAVVGANDDLRISGAKLKPGRWYAIPVNIGNTTARFDLTASLEFGGTRAQPAYGHWHNPQRGGAGWVLSPLDEGEAWMLNWYTFLPDGTPVWYGGEAPAPDPQEGSVSFNLHRNAWDGALAHGTVVGMATLSLMSAHAMQVSWNLDGESGSERLLHENAGCVALGNTALAPDGHWVAPSGSGFSADALAYPGLEKYIGYVYDGRGMPRWVWASRNTDASIGDRADLSAELSRGACPLCSYVQPVSESAGIFRRRYFSPTRGFMGATVTFPSPMSGEWRTYEEVIKLTSPINCP